MTYGAVDFITDPPGAEVINLRDDTNIGSTPVQVIWESDDGSSENVTVKFRKKGYLEKIVPFWVNKRHQSREAANAEPQPVKVELVKRK